jgi:hypothetical protein
MADDIVSFICKAKKAGVPLTELCHPYLFHNYSVSVTNAAAKEAYDAIGHFIARSIVKNTD